MTVQTTTKYIKLSSKDTVEQFLQKDTDAIGPTPEVERPDAQINSFIRYLSMCRCTDIL